MDGRCKRSPHKGHYWVEEIPESDRWECHWCGQVRHFNHERIEKAQMSEATQGANEAAEHDWLHGQAFRRTSRRTGDISFESGLGRLGEYSSLSSV